MTERDQLAALLGRWLPLDIGGLTYEELADRLIAAGFGFTAEWYHRGRNRGLAEADLDVERLARALQRTGLPRHDQNASTYAAAIAAAYREDAG